MNRFDALYILSQVVAIASVIGVAPVGDAIDKAFNRHGLGTSVVAAFALVALVGGKILDRLKNPSPPAGTQPALLPDPSPTPPRVKDLIPQSAAVEAQKDTTS